MPKTASMIPRGAIVLVPFPFTDLSSVKVRPALVISSNNSVKADVVVAFLSSVVKKSKPEEDVLITLTDKDFLSTGIKMTSVIKCRKVATLDRSIILGELGNISSQKMRQVDMNLKKILGL